MGASGQNRPETSRQIERVTSNASAPGDAPEASRQAPEQHLGDFPRSTVLTSRVPSTTDVPGTGLGNQQSIQLSPNSE
ncbi:MAG: hypothetical protein ABEI52_09525, partial [Halobacteriaceae archaeon]